MWKEFLSKKFVFSLPFRWIVVLAFILCILSFVILIHLLVEKCNKYWSNNVSNSEVVENEETEEHYSFVDFYTVVNYLIVISFILFIRFSLQYYLLSTRISLLINTVRKIVLKLFLYLYFRTKVLKFRKVILKFRNLSKK